MTPAAHYRELAEECFGWAQEARDVGVRQQYAKLCLVWLHCATCAELQSGATTRLEPIIQKVA